MPKPPQKAAELPRRRVSVGRKQAKPEVPFDTQVAIEQAIAALDIEKIHQILLSQEVQLNALRIIVFDFQSILRQETQKRAKPVTKERFNRFVSKLRTTIETNARDLAGAHPNPEEVNDPLPREISDQDRDSIIEETFGPLSDWSNVNQPTQQDEEEADEMEDMLEQAAAETEDLEQAVRRAHRRRARVVRPPRS